MILDKTFKELAEINAENKYWDADLGKISISLLVILKEEVCVIDFEMLLKIVSGAYDPCRRLELCTFLFNAQEKIRKQNETDTTT